jgi:hypothetical protein
MRNLRLLLLFAVVAAVGSYSALAGAGSTPVTDPSAAGAQRTDAGDGARPSVREQEGDAAEDGKGADKVVQAIADEFGVSKDEVLARHNEGIGFGALFKLYKLARAQGISVDELLATIPTDANGERDFAFGQRRKAMTDEQRALYESGPKNLGRFVSAKSKKHDEPAVEGATESGEKPQGRGKKGHVPPGQAKKAARR